MRESNICVQIIYQYSNVHPCTLFSSILTLQCPNLHVESESRLGWQLWNVLSVHRPPLLAPSLFRCWRSCALCNMYGLRIGRFLIEWSDCTALSLRKCSVSSKAIIQHPSPVLCITSSSCSRDYLIRPTQSIMYVPLQINRFQKIILLIVQYNI